MARPSGRPIREEVIDAACTMVQRVGVNALSYGALATQLGISSPSIHHHFRTKDDLVAEVVGRYRVSFNQFVDAIDADDCAGRIRAYSQLFDDTSSNKLMCLCGSVASDWLTVGDRAQAEVALFFTDQVEWVTLQLNAGADAGEFRLRADAGRVAQTIVAALEGAMLVARAGAKSGLPALVGDVLIDSLIAQR